jgi:class 3 adenylate cyclase
MADSATQGAQAEEPKLGFVLLTDIAGSQPQAEGYPAEYEEAEAQHDAIIKEVAAKHGGRRDLSTGDGFYAVFGTARSAVMAAVEMQSRIAAEVKALPDESHLRVRCLLHAGLLGHKPEDDRPTGNVFRELARMAAKDGLRVNGGQIVVTGQVQRHLAYAPPPDGALRQAAALSSPHKPALRHYRVLRARIRAGGPAEAGARRASAADQLGGAWRLWQVSPGD